MRKNNIWSIFFTLLFAASAVFLLIPSVKLYSEKDPDVRKKMLKENPKLRSEVINMGLDIQGGLRMVLEFDMDKVTEEERKKLEADAELIDKAYIKIQNRLNKTGLSETTIQKVGKDRLIVELPGIDDSEDAKEMIKKTAKLNFHIVKVNPGTDQFEQQLTRIDNILKGVETAVDSSKIKDTTSSVDGLDSLDALDELENDTTKITEEPAKKTIEERKGAITLSTYYDKKNRAFLDSKREEINALLARRDVKNAMRVGTKMLWNFEPLRDRATGKLILASDGSGSKLYQMYIVQSEPAMSGNNLKKASYQPSQRTHHMEVSLSFNPQGASDFAKVTRRNIGNQLAVVLDDIVFSAPNINERILGDAVISGSFSKKEAKNLAAVLEAGKLPVDLKIIQETKVGPSLGKNALDKAAKAAGIGFLLVVIFMVVYYKLSGLLAITALFLNVVFVLAIMASFGATLTLPGIAGLILIMGMSVDANVIVFERIKEEIAIGKDVRRAIEAGYGRAFVAIMDANITTLFTALILYGVGSGPIRGFAVTLICGILVSLFTALTFTKMIYSFFTASGKVKKLSI